MATCTTIQPLVDVLGTSEFIAIAASDSDTPEDKNIGNWIAKQMIPAATLAKLKLALMDARGSAASLVGCGF